MTKANFHFKNDSFISFEIKGHANYSDYGTDIVCSAITSATFTTINLLDKLFNGMFDLVQKEVEGYVSLTVKEVINDKTFKAIIDNLIDMLKFIEEQYPQNIQVVIK